MNPCPCGFAGDESGRCLCTADQIQRYRSRISGPLLDRIDIQVEVTRPNRMFFRKSSSAPEPEGSAAVRRRAVAARNIQLDRAGVSNAEIDCAGVRQYCTLDEENQDFIEQVSYRMALSPRACQRILKVARTLADMERQPSISRAHLAEAISYRGMDCGKHQG